MNTVSRFTNSKTGGVNKFKRDPNAPKPTTAPVKEEIKDKSFKVSGKFTMATKWNNEPETWKEAEEKKKLLELEMSKQTSTEQTTKPKPTFKIFKKANLKLGDQPNEEDKQAILDAKMKALEEKEKEEQQKKKQARQIKTTSKLFKNTKKVKLGANDEEEREKERLAALERKRKMEMEMGIKEEPVKKEKKTEKSNRKVSNSNTGGNIQGTTTGAKW